MNTYGLVLLFPVNTAAPRAKPGSEAINGAPILFDSENPIPCFFEGIRL